MYVGKYFLWPLGKEEFLKQNPKNISYKKKKFILLHEYTIH